MAAEANTTPFQKLTRESYHLWHEDLTGIRKVNPWIACGKLLVSYRIARLIGRYGMGALFTGLAATAFEWSDAIRHKPQDSLVNYRRIRSVLRGVQIACALSLFRHFKGAITQGRYLEVTGFGIASLWNVSCPLAMAAGEFSRKTEAQKKYLEGRAITDVESPFRRTARVYLTKALKVVGIRYYPDEGVPAHIALGLPPITLPHQNGRVHGMQWQQEFEQGLVAATQLYAQDELGGADAALQQRIADLSAEQIQKLSDIGAEKFQPVQLEQLLSTDDLASLSVEKIRQRLKQGSYGQ